MSRGRFLLAAAWLSLLALPARAAWSPPPAPTQWVTDKAGLLTPGVQSYLNARLRQFNEQTGHQVLVYVAQSLEGQALEDFGARSLAAWRVGRKGIDDGLILFIFKDDRKIRIEVGYGLEDKVPDAVASRIIREQIVPKLQQGQGDQAITAAVTSLLQAIGGEAGGVAGPAPQGAAGPAPQPAPQPEPSPVTQHSALFNVLGGIIAVLVILFLITHPWFALQLLLSAAFGSGGGGGGGGFSGGGGGGFSGGGGSSGGGGASGSW